MKSPKRRGIVATTPALVSAALVLTACGGGGSSATSAVAQAPAAAVPQSAAVSAPVAAPAKVDSAPKADGTTPASTTSQHAAAVAAAPQGAAAPAKVAAPHAAAASVKAAKPVDTTKAPAAEAATNPQSIDSPSQAASNAKIAQEKNGATDIGVTKDEIRLGTVNMHGLALGNVFVQQLANGTTGTANAINDRGGILGRRLRVIDCDDGPGEVSRTKACVKKLVTEDKIFSFIGITSWGSASIHDDLKQYQIPAFSQWAYSQTEWQDAFMFPTHMSMIHEAIAGGNWVRNVIHPKTYGLICLTSPEMSLACDQVERVLDASGAKMVKRADVSISETSMSAYVLAMRAANPDHIVHYVINPATVAKFMVEAGQQGYYPPKGISGNHLAAEVLGSIFGKWPTGRYWTNTTYKMWGSQFIATMTKYARSNAGANHHIVQAVYSGEEFFEHAGKEVGPNLTRQRMMAAWDNGQVFRTDADMDQKFSYKDSERHGDNWDHNMGQGREFMYKYTSENTRANPDGSPNGFEPDPGQFVIYTDH
jgi:ABC-type branched-subunit amino acid transport system substrate-binding protein